MTDTKSDDACKDCEPTFKAFLQEMAEHNKEVIQGKFTCPTCGKVREYTLPNPSTSARGEV
jgi:hypothetical protein